jgi:Zn-dependent peptidase ImmA (M78 family)/DNA-binding XRE family transcriptional regulator
MPIYGERVRQVRKLRRLTQRQFAEQVGVKQNTISQIEAGFVRPSAEVCSAIAESSGFPEDFFLSEPGPEFPLGSLVFRARRLATKSELAEAHAWAELLYECALGLATRLGIQPTALPNLSGEPPHRAAWIARSALGLSPDRPIPNVVHALEQRGVLVLALPVSLPGRDAFSAWAGTNPRFPVLMLPSGGLGGRQRFTVSHELDHLLTPDFRGYSRMAEETADRFASEFLLPEAGIRDELPAPMSIAKLAPLARRWGVSLQSLIMRTSQLGVISQRRAQQLYIELSSAGFARKEPASVRIRVEKPRGFRRMAELTYGNPVDGRRLAADFHLPLPLASAVLGAHATRMEMLSTVPSEPGENIIEFPSRY